MPRSRTADLEFALHWQGPWARHRGRVYFGKLNIWRDFFPGALADADSLYAPWGGAA